MFDTLRKSSLRLVVLAALAGSAVSPAAAFTRYVSPGGSDTNTGLAPSTAWRTIAKANASAQAGDLVLVADGTYADFPNPAVSGSAGNRITYVGNLASPASVVVSARGAFSKSYVTVKGMTLNGGLVLSGSRDSLTDCLVFGSRSDLSAANDCLLARLVVNSDRFWVFGQETDSLVKASRDTLQDCVFNLNANDGSGHVVRLRSIEACVFDRNVWNITSGPSAVGGSAFKLFWVRHCRFRDSRWNIVDNCTGACDEAGWFMQRDYTQGNSWARDTIDMGGPGAVQFFGSGSGSYPGSVMHNTYDRLLVRLNGNSAYGAAMVYQDAARWDTLTNCTFIGRSGAMQMNGSLEGPILVDHCTFVGFNPGLGTFGCDVGATNVWSGKVALRSNVFYTAPSAPRSKNAAAAYIPYNAAHGHLVSNYNVFYTPMPRDSAIYLTGIGVSAPGVGKLFCTDMAADSNSVWGSPRFTDSSAVAAFNPRLLPGSTAIGAAWGGGDAGSFPVSGALADLAAPAAVGDLAAAAVTPSTLVLEWTAPGDLPNLGPAAQYDLRWSAGPITEGNFGAATPLSPQPSPRAPGAFESYGVTGLTSGATYYYALRSRDVAGNWSAVSNVPAVVASADHTPPAAIIDLSAH